MADDAGVAEEAGDVAVVEGGHLLRLESGEGLPEPVALPEDRQPGQTRLEPFQAELLVEADVVDHRPAPLVVVVRLVVRRAARPGAPSPPVLPPDCRHGSEVGHGRQARVSGFAG
jgi:hypothetical protein